MQNSSHETIAPRARAPHCVALIAAVAQNRVIGAGNRLPWRLADDMKHFRAMTMGHTVIMGRKTWESLPRALPERQNIVVTRQAAFVATGAEIASSFADALLRARLPEPVFCIGGGELYREALPYATQLHLTEIAGIFDGDTEFPQWVRGDWRETARDTRAGEGLAGIAYAYVTYVRDAPTA